MKTSLRNFIFISCFAIMLVLTMVTGNNAQTVISEETKLGLRNLGSIGVGMTVSQAQQASGLTFNQVASGGEPDCLYYETVTLKDVSFMVTEGKIARIDIDNPRITTLSGAKIGDSERRIYSLYPRQIQSEPHEYVTGGHYLSFTPRDRIDQNYRMVFETNGRVVTRFRSGKLPEVNYIEGCA